MTRPIYITLLVLGIAAIAAGCTEKAGEKEFNSMEERAMYPFWQGPVVYDEAFLLLSSEDQHTQVDFLYPPTEIISVKSARLDKEFLRGEDWDFKDGRFIVMENSSIPVMARDQMYVPEYREADTVPRKDGKGALYFREDGFFHNLQIVITYKHSGNWEGPVPVFAGDKLPLTIAKLQRKEPVKIVLFGDSISVGGNSSELINEPPYLPIWGKLLVHQLERAYEHTVQFVNPSLGGVTAAWGVEQAKLRAASENADLVIVAFGMNDGSGRILPLDFKRNIQAIVEEIRSTKADTELILVAPSLANPEAIHSGFQSLYAPVLEEISEAMTGVMTVDMTAVHQELLKHKPFRDTTANNVNHPNDYLARWHAQIIAGHLIEND
ncbi:SGNH/GDSL hydrolase family protein [Paenibacillus sp. J5C_2022]|nr:SGNH/GDSL hydrolase family protein [Paenibacillus sp. J5C2022]